MRAAGIQNLLTKHRIGITSPYSSRRRIPHVAVFLTSPYSSQSTAKKSLAHAADFSSSAKGFLRATGRQQRRKAFIRAWRYNSHPHIMALTSGTKLGPYEILAPLGAGGMGEVYRARDTRLGRDVAVKILSTPLSFDPGLKQRFEREARAVCLLTHPNICCLYDIGSQDGTDFIVMEYLEGETLADRLSTGPLPLPLALKIGVEIADALDKAHREGIIHRDLKPGNIMLTKSGAELTDSGLAKAVTATLRVVTPAPAPSQAPNPPTISAAALTSPYAPFTEHGTIVGTLLYMAPESIQGQPADLRSDIFSFGCVLYEMVSGRRPFTGESRLSIVAAILEKNPQPMAGWQPLTPAALEAG